MSPPLRYTLVSSAASPSSAGPMAATLDVTTTRGTISAAAASTTRRGVSAFICQSRSRGWDPT